MSVTNFGAWHCSQKGLLGVAGRRAEKVDIGAVIQVLKAIVACFSGLVLGAVVTVVWRLEHWL